jgi:hypothetical protein
MCSQRLGAGCLVSQSSRVSVSLKSISYKVLSSALAKHGWRFDGATGVRFQPQRLRFHLDSLIAQSVVRIEQWILISMGYSWSNFALTRVKGSSLHGWGWCARVGALTAASCDAKSCATCVDSIVKVLQYLTKRRLCLTYPYTTITFTQYTRPVHSV